MTEDSCNNLDGLDLSVDGFKKWMNENEVKRIGLQKETDDGGFWVEPRVSTRKIMSRIDIEDGDAFDVAEDFRDNGGKVMQMDGDLFLIEVDAGSFMVPRRYCRKKR